jgi:hypothetical protein
MNIYPPPDPLNTTNLYLLVFNSSNEYINFKKNNSNNLRQNNIILGKIEEIKKIQDNGKIRILAVIKNITDKEIEYFNQETGEILLLSNQNHIFSSNPLTSGLSKICLDKPEARNLYSLILLINTRINTMIKGDIPFNCKIRESDIKKYLYRNQNNLNLNTILNDLLFLEAEYKLTSRLAIFIYKLLTYDFKASDKVIGTYFALSFGKSKILNNKRFNVVQKRGYVIPRYAPIESLSPGTLENMAKTLLVNNYQATDIASAMRLDIGYVLKLRQ